ncbi:FAD-dependent oxidoreductase [Gordonia hydrophobica]|uniref:ferredoxin--NADP(+) reductase n=1 Tax=Gordonia hydrophobica TaxID=40516 RepID=A0ABZ2U303_9ACTN|nr:FAD-dependent oxidoreductase [Gordonia hydrophobica]MBM7367387.1 ferredoxin--NADP+ reductase [Gordonia hydrophobica]
MTYVVTQNCCNEASCIAVCPVDCIHPGPGEPGYRTTEMLYIDPVACIDCGACADACPVEAISPDESLEGLDLRYLEINAGYYAGAAGTGTQCESAADRDPTERSDGRLLGRVAVVEQASPLRVAVVGSGPAASYAAEELLANRDVDVEVTMLERLPFAGGLVRYGVAPDHSKTKLVERGYARTLGRPGMTAYLGVEVGRDLTLDELADHHHAVIVATGADRDRQLGIPGESLAGVHGAREFVAWYNGHPDLAEARFDLSSDRAVVIGNGNVALDVARILVSDIDDLRRTDIADHALDALAASAIRDVVVIGRRGPAAAACTVPELLGLSALDGVDVLVDDRCGDAEEADSVGPEVAYKVQLLREYAAARPQHDRRLTLRFHAAPQEILGAESVDGVRLAAPDGSTDDLAAGLVLRSIGYRGTPFADLPFDAQTGTVANIGGRVHSPESDAPVPGRYVAGWIKRGPTGVIGTNKLCAQETVAALLEDYAAGALAEPVGSASEFADVISQRRPQALSAADWVAVDRYERSLGRKQKRPRVKLLDPGPALAKRQ